MLLSAYIEKYRGGKAALTQAEARIAGISGDMKRGWFKRAKYKIVDPAAMVAARGDMGAKKKFKAASIAAMKAKNRPEKVKALFSKYEPAQMPVVVSDATDDRYAYVNSPAFLASFEWRQARFATLKRYGAKCQCCGATPATGAVMNVDHIKSRRRRPELALDLENLQVLCGDCNHGKGNDEVDFRTQTA